MKKILIVSTYDIQSPLHGGQRRVRAMFDFLSRYNHVEFLSITESPVKLSQKNIFNISFGKKIKSPKTLTILEDYRQMKFLTESDDVQSQLACFLKTRDFDIIQFEHPWLYPFFKRSIDLKKFRVFYSSHNVEFKLKEDLIHAYQPNVNLFEVAHGSGISAIPQEKVDEIVSEIKSVEIELVSNSELVVGVSESDIEEFKKYSPKSTALVRNCPGVSVKTEASESKVPYCAFVGSGHPPNVNGFLEMMGDMLGYFSPEEKVYLLGEVAIAIQMDTRYRENLKLNSSRVQVFYPLNDNDLAKGLTEARCIVLPIREGGGSNLKTAEALLAGRPIVATSKAFRGFDEFVREKEIYIEDAPKMFRKRVVDILRRTENPYVIRDHKKLERLNWDYQIQLISNRY